MNFTILAVAIITILGLVLRLIGIEKDGGLWNDEYVSWSISVIPFGKAFIDGIISQCHMPFYYLYLKCFNIFSADDTFLRITSIIPGIIAIPVMYIVGHEKSKLTGFSCAIFTSLSSLLVYYSQEVRFYSLLFLFSALSLYFTQRVVNKPRKKNLAGLIIANLMILITHTIGFVYVFFDILYVTLKLKRFYRKFVIYTWIITGVFFAITMPLLLKILFFTNSMSQWWTNLNLYRVAQIFADYFTPIISNVSVIENIHEINLTAMFLIVPALIALIVYLACIFDKHIRHSNQILYVAVATLLVAIIAALTGKLSINAKYIIEIYPILIFVFCSTIDSYNNLLFKLLIFTIFFAFQLGYVFSPNYASKLPREEGNKYVADLIKSAKLSKNDFIVITYYPKSRFSKYIDLSKYNVIEIYKGNFNYYFAPFLTSEEALKIGKNKYRGTFLNALTPVKDFSGSELITRLNNEVYYKMKQNQKVAFVFLDSVSFLDEYMFRAVITNPVAYEKAPLPYIVFSDIRNEIIKTIPLKARNLRFETKGAWTVVSFQY